LKPVCHPTGSQLPHQAETGSPGLPTVRVAATTANKTSEDARNSPRGFYLFCEKTRI